MHSVRIELAKLILVGTRITYQATGEAVLHQICNARVEITSRIRGWQKFGSFSLNQIVRAWNRDESSCLLVNIAHTQIPQHYSSGAVTKARVWSAGAGYVPPQMYYCCCAAAVAVRSVSSIGPSARNSYLEWASDSNLLLKVRSLSYITFIIHGRYWNVFFLCGFLLFMPAIRNGFPLPRILDGREYWEWRKKTCNLQVTSNKLPDMNKLKTKHNVFNLDTCAYFSHTGHQPDPPSRVPPRCNWNQIIPTRHIVYQVLDSTYIPQEVQQ